MRTQLLTHNKTAYQKVMKALETSDRTCVVHPTGTGKSFLIAAVSESFSKVLILGPNDFVLEQVHSVLSWRDKSDAGAVVYMTYQMLWRADEVPTGYDLICLDEFHRAGAPAWGVAVDELLEQNPQAKVFGTTATPIRYLNNERDMSDELFHRNVASLITIGEAWSRSILPVPVFVTGLFNFHKTLADAEERIANSRKLSEEEKRQRLYRLSNARLEWENSMGMPAILQRHLDKDIRRVIIFCADIARLESMRETVVGWFRMGGFKVASSCMVHIGQTDRQIREAMDEFGSDEGDGVRLMFSVNMLNEGVHIPRVGAVLMLRTTSSRIIYLQQMGRCLTAANTEKPVILDMVDNITTTSAVHGLMDDFEGWQHMMKSDLADYEERRFKVTDYRQSLRDVLQKISPMELSFETWEEKLEQLTEFCEKHGRTPSRSDGDIFRKYAYLISNYRETDEVKLIIQKYGRQIMWNENNRNFMEQELRDFIDFHHRAPSRWLVEDQRWYKMYKVIEKHEPEHSLVIECKRLEEMRKAEEHERYYNESKEILSAFFEKEGRLPRKTPSEEGIYEPYLKWVWIRKNYPDDPFVAESRCRYAQHVVVDRKVLPLEKRIDLCEAICKEYGRQPHASYDDPTTVKSWTYLKRLHGDHPRVKELLKYPVLRTNHKRMERGIRKVEEFYGKHGRLPYSRGNGNEEVKAYNSMVNIFTKYPDNPRVKALMEKRGRGVTLERSISNIVEFEREKGRLPKSSTESKEYDCWKRLVKSHHEEPEIKALMEKYPDPDGCGWLATKKEREAARKARQATKTAVSRRCSFETDFAKVKGFAEKHGRLPRSNSTTDREEDLTYQVLRRLRDSHSDRKEVKELLEAYPQVSSTLEKGMVMLRAFVEKENRLPRDTADASPEERRVLSTWKALKKNHPGHPLTKELLSRFPYGNDKTGLAIKMLAEFEAEHHRLPTSRKNGVEGESKVYEKLEYLRREYADHPVVKGILDRYKDWDPRLAIRNESFGKVERWVSEHGRLPKLSKKDKEERNVCMTLKYFRKRHPDMPELKAMLDSYVEKE